MYCEMLEEKSGFAANVFLFKYASEIKNISKVEWFWIPQSRISLCFISIYKPWVMAAVKIESLKAATSGPVGCIPLGWYSQ